MTHDIDENRPMNPGLLAAERDAALARAEQAEARVAELEAALRAYACDCTGDGACPPELQDLLGCGMVARQALAGTKKPPA